MSGNAKAVLEGQKLETIVDRQIMKDVLSMNNFHTRKLKSTNYDYSENEEIQIFRQRGIYHYLSEKQIIFKDFVSKIIVPDMLIINNKEKKIFIIEVKNQTSSGSVDEKLQTGNYKIHFFKKLFLKNKEYKNYSIEYHYVVSEHFSKPEYIDIREYIASSIYSPDVYLHIGKLPKNLI